MFKEQRANVDVEIAMHKLALKAAQPPKPKPPPPRPPRPPPPPPGHEPSVTNGIAEVSLTQGQVNAVRAAFKAGITPSRIARQFGIFQSNIRKALASDPPK